MKQTIKVGVVGVGHLGHHVCEPEQGPGMAVLRRVGLEPATVGLAEIQESPGLGAEGGSQKVERTPEAST